MKIINFFNLAKIFATSILVVFALSASGQSPNAIFPVNAWGVYSWTQITNIDSTNAPLAKGGPIIMRWAEIEPQKGVFTWNDQLRPKLQKALDNNFYVFLKIYLAAPARSGFTPEWLYTNGVPKVAAGGNFPYYFDDDYKFYYYRLIAEFGRYVQTLPDELKNRILFIQSTEGTTGDGGYYKGDPAGTQFDINDSQWSEFRLEAWKKFKAAFSNNGELQFPILTNNDANTGGLRDWMLNELPRAIGVKNGMFTHGYQISDAQDRLKEHLALKAEAEAAGKVFFARGEMDAEMHEKGWINQNKKQGIYWSAIYATHCAVSLWNFPQDDLIGLTYSDGINFFNKYAGEINPGPAKGAFCAFYRGLDSSDTITFPESKHGSAEKSNSQRYESICRAFASFGANMADASAATGGGMVNRDATGYNDAGWKILKTNFQRHLTQVDAEITSNAYWQVDNTVYGRFARGFEADSNVKNKMFFNLDDRFFGNEPLNGTQPINVSITYRDTDVGSWQLKYHATDGTMKNAMSIVNTGAGNNVWTTKTVTIRDAKLDNGGERQADFILVNTGNTNCRFHMIAVDKTISTTPQNTVTVIANDSNSSEPSDDASFLFSRSGDISKSLNVSYLISGTASSGLDYLNLGTTVSFAAGQSSVSKILSVTNDNIIENNETVILTLASGLNYTIGSPNSATVSIDDDDFPTVVTVVATDATASEPTNNGIFTFTRTGNTNVDMTVNFTTSGTAIGGSDYQSFGNSVSILAGQSSATVFVNIINDDLIESNETLIVTLASNANYTVGSPSSSTVSMADEDVKPTVTISHINAAEPLKNGSLTFTRTGGVSDALTVKYTVEGTATSGLDYSPISTTVVIPTGQVSVSATVVVIDDNVPEVSETVIVKFLSQVSYNIGIPSEVNLIIADNDVTILPTVSVIAPASNASEPATNSNFTFTRTGSTAASLTVNYSISGNATNGTDYANISTSVIIPASQASLSIPVTVIDDSVSEASETVIVTLTSNANYTISSSGSATVVLNDNEIPNPWQTMDIGAVGASGSAGLVNSTWTILGSGADIWSTADEFRYVYQSSTGPCSIIARVTSLSNTNGWAKAGLMIRESVAANARCVMVCLTPSNGITLQYRTTTGGITSQVKVAGGIVPQWLKLTRVTGDVFTAFYSDTGITWNQVGTPQTIIMPSIATFGLALSSHNDGVICTSTIDNVIETP